MEREVLGKIEVWVMRDGKIPSQVEGISEFQTMNVLSSLISHVNQSMSGKRQELTQEEKQKLVALIYQTFGAEDGFKIINALAWCINRISLRMSKDKHIEIADMPLMPDVTLKELS